jgi:hypothetical protein
MQFINNQICYSVSTTLLISFLFDITYYSKHSPSRTIRQSFVLFENELQKYGV